MIFPVWLLILYIFFRCVTWGDCSYQKSKVFQDVVLSEYIQVARKQEDQLLSVVADQGVISIVVNAGRQWQQYKGGVVDDDEFCDSDELNHAVAIVGWHCCEFFIEYI